VFVYLGLVPRICEVFSCNVYIDYYLLYFGNLVKVEGELAGIFDIVNKKGLLYSLIIRVHTLINCGYRLNLIKPVERTFPLHTEGITKASRNAQPISVNHHSHHIYSSRPRNQPALEKLTS
jgi:hypothetical protein